VAAFLVFLASGAVLVLEIVGLRLVGPYVGVTLQTSSTVIGVALGAIAYGAWLGGKLADRRDARQLLGPCLLLASVATAVTLPAVRYAGEWLRGTHPVSMLLLTIMTLFLPAALLSAVTPLVIKLELRHIGQTGRVVGRLSSIGTLGAIVATLSTGYVFVAALPTSRIVVSVAAVLAVVGAWLTFKSRRSRKSVAGAALVTLLTAGAGAFALLAPTPCDVETAYHCARVTTDPMRASGRILWLNSTRQSYLDVENPQHLEYAYTQWIGRVVDSMAPPRAPLSILHLGGGGFTLPAYVNATRPGSKNLVIELDAELVELDRSALGLRTGPNLAVLTGDGRIHLSQQPSDGFDLLIGDAFGHLSVPWHLATREFVEDVRRVVRPGGIYALNVIDWPPAHFFRAELATVLAVFRHVAVILPPGGLQGPGGANFVILASDAPLPLAELAPRLGSWPAPAELLRQSDLGALIRDASILTDDYAPVDQLRAASSLM
jgi:spermidine synthase